MKVLIIDYGMSNLGSITRAVEECGGEDIVVSSDSKEVIGADKIILPGVGSFSDGMKNLRALGFVPLLKDHVLEKKIPFLGICLGMQLLATEGDEGGKTEGLNLIKGAIKKLKPKGSKERLPHVGWNEIKKTREDRVLNNIEDGSDFYFVHSYNFIPEKAKDILATTPYCGKFVSIVNRDNVYGVQFHPEKSSRVGFELLRNFLKI